MLRITSKPLDKQEIKSTVRQYEVPERSPLFGSDDLVTTINLSYSGGLTRDRKYY